MSSCTWYRGTTVDGWSLVDLGGLKRSCERMGPYLWQEASFDLGHEQDFGHIVLGTAGTREAVYASSVATFMHCSVCC